MTQDSLSGRVSEGMEASRFAALEPVCCLDCGKEYAKPTGGGTLTTNPGCPHCGYVGWVPNSARLTAGWRRARSGADRRQRRAARAG